MISFLVAIRHLVEVIPIKIVPVIVYYRYERYNEVELMIKKLTVCFLVMAIAGGCAQTPVEADKPEEPPVVEQPQKPEEETKVKKIEDYVTVEQYPLTMSIDQEEFNKEWKSSFRYDFVTVNLDSEDAQVFNDKMLAIFNECKEAVILYPEGYVQRAIFFDANCYLNDSVLSVVTRRKEFLYQAGGVAANYEVYNFDLATGNLLSNDELIEKINQSYSDLWFEEDNEKKAINFESKLFMKDNQLMTLQTVNMSQVIAVFFRNEIEVKNN